MNEIIDNFVPQIPRVVELQSTFVRPWVSGYIRSPFATYLKYVDVDPATWRQVDAR